MIQGARDVVLLTLDTGGNILNYKTFGRPDKASFHDLAVSNQNAYLTGIVEKSITDKKSILIAMKEAISSSYDLTDSKNSFTIYPNPANGHTILKFHNYRYKSCNIIVYEIDGKKIKDFKLDSDCKETNIELNQYGLLFFEITFLHYRITRKVNNKR